jgi:hypothetical protein
MGEKNGNRPKPEAAPQPAGGAIGALARIAPTALLESLSIPQSGKVYDLGLELNDTIPHNSAFTPLALTFPAFSPRCRVSVRSTFWRI